MRKPAINASVIAVISVFYSMVFVITSGHIEFERMLNHKQTLQSDFWNGWSVFLKEGNMKYVGFIYLTLAAVVVVLSLLKKKNYDEYQISILAKSFIVAGIAIVFLFPVAFLLILSDPNYSIEIMMFLVVAHWSALLIADLLFVIRWYRS
jgi:hypothetical protein